MRAAVLLGLATACTSGPESKLGGELLPDGFIRYTGSPITIQAGETAQFVQWVSPALDHDMDVVAVRGSQGPGGHHAIFYASPDLEPVGITRRWTPADQITARFLGGTGGEGSSSVTELPPGAVLRVPAGSAFYIQSHYLNASDTAIESTSTIDIKLADPSPDATVLSMFVNGTLAINVPPGQSQQTLTCDVQEDTQLVMYFNHIHETGTAVVTDLATPDGVVQPIKDDLTWNAEWATRPNPVVEALDHPFIVPVGGTLTTVCSWDNPTTKTFGFPDEMCAFVSFYIGTHDRACSNGHWVDL